MGEGGAEESMGRTLGEALGGQESLRVTLGRRSRGLGIRKRKAGRNGEKNLDVGEGGGQK